jgi:hypothetical protein
MRLRPWRRCLNFWVSMLLVTGLLRSVEGPVDREVIISEEAPPEYKSPEKEIIVQEQALEAQREQSPVATAPGGVTGAGTGGEAITTPKLEASTEPARAEKTIVIELPAGAATLAERTRELWQSPELADKLPAVRFSQTAQQVDLQAHIEALRAPVISGRDFEDLQLQQNLTVHSDQLRQLDTVLQEMAQDTLNFASSLKPPVSSDVVVSTAMTLATLGRLRSDIIYEQSRIASYLSTFNQVQANRLRPLLQALDISPEDFTLGNLDQAIKSIASLTQGLQKVDPRVIAQETQGLAPENPEQAALEAFINGRLLELQKKARELALSVEETSENGIKLKEAREALDNLQNTATKLNSELEFQVDLVQTRTFATRLREFFESMRSFFESVGLKVTSLGNIIVNIASGSPLGAEDLQAMLKLISSPLYDQQMQTLYSDLQKRSAEFDLFMQKVSKLRVLATQATPLSSSQLTVLGELRSALTDYLTMLSTLGKGVGLVVRNPTTFGSHIFEFISRWYRPPAQSITQDQLTLLTAISQRLGGFEDLVLKLDKQSRTAATLLETIEANIIKQSSPAAQALYNFSFATSLISNIGGALAWGVTQPVTNILARLGTTFNTTLPQFLLPAPYIIVAAAAILEAVSYGIYRAAIYLAARSPTA